VSARLLKVAFWFAGKIRETGSKDNDAAIPPPGFQNRGMLVARGGCLGGPYGTAAHLSFDLPF